jgi:hypothetical protein
VVVGILAVANVRFGSVAEEVAEKGRLFQGEVVALLEVDRGVLGRHPDVTVQGWC